MRLLQRIVSAVLALALVLAGLLAGAEIALAALGRGPWVTPYPAWDAWSRQQTWSSPGVRAALAVTAVVGLALIVLGLRAGRPASVPLPARADGPDEVQVTASRRALEKALAAATQRVSGVSGADAALTRKRVRVTARTTLRQGDLQGEVTEAVTTRLRDWGLADTLAASVKVARRGGR